MEDETLFHSEKFKQSFQERIQVLWTDKRFVDFTLKVDDKLFQVHKVVLASSSDYFKAMFSYDSYEAKNNEVIIRDITVTAIDAILKFCYTSKIIISIDNVQEILLAASQFQIKELERICADFIRERIDEFNCLAVLSVADRCELNNLFEDAFTYCLENFEKVVLGKDFLELDENLLIKLIADDALNVFEESNVFFAIVKWYSANEDQRFDKLIRLMSNVRFVFMEPAKLISLSSHETIERSPECKNLIEEAKNYLLLYGRPEQPIITHDRKYRPRNPLKRQQRIYAIGGWSDKIKSISYAEIYDPNINQWTELTPMSEKRCGVGVVSLNKFIYAIGGHDGDKDLKSVERYDIEQGSWHRVADMNYDRTSLGVVTLKGAIYAIGGQSSSQATNIVERYHPNENQWSVQAHLMDCRLGAGVAVLEEQIYVIGGGGSGNKTTLNSMERWDSRLGWEYVAPMSTRRKHFGCTTYDGKIYVVGGRNEDGELDSGECYDPRTGEWTPITSMQKKRCGIGLVGLGGLLYAIGGNEDSRLTSVEAYDPLEKRWVWKEPMKYQRLGGGMVVYPPS